MRPAAGGAQFLVLRAGCQVEPSPLPHRHALLLKTKSYSQAIRPGGEKQEAQRVAIMAALFLAPPPSRAWREDRVDNDSRQRARNRVPRLPIGLPDVHKDGPHVYIGRQSDLIQFKVSKILRPPFAFINPNDPP